MAIALLSAAALFLVTAAWPDTPDGLFHLQRVRALAAALKAGVFYPRWFPDFSFGYGYPVLHYYAPGFYFGPALAVSGGAELLTAARLALAAVYGLSGAACYLLCRTWCGKPAALVATALYLLFPYRLYDLFVRGALPEFAAFLWLPLVALFSHRLVRTWSAGWPRRSGPLASAALCWAGLILTHNLTALLAALAGAWVLAVVLCAGPWTRAAFRARLAPLLGVLGAFALGALLSAWYVVPALLEARWVGVGAGSSRGYQAHFSSWQPLFAWDLLYRYPTAAEPIVPLPGIALILMLAGIGALFLESAAGRRTVIAAGLAVVLGSTWLATDSSAGLWDLGTPLLGNLQFPWRWYTLTAPALALLAALVFELAAARPSAGWQYALAVLVGGTLVAHSWLALQWQPLPLRSDEIAVDQMWAFDAAAGQVGASWTGEFLPRWVTEQRWAIGRELPEAITDSPSAIDMEAEARNAGYLRAEYEVTLAAPGQVVLDRFYFPPWRVTAGGVPAVTRPVGPLGLLAADLPAGQYVLAVEWEATPGQWIGRLLSAVAWAVLLWLLWKRPGRAAALAWFGLGLFALAVAGGLFERMEPAQPVRGDFGAIQLTGLTTQPGHPGGVARVDLHWLVTASGVDQVAFVHVVGSDGRVVAQQDGPPAGPYKAPARWQPGMLVTGSLPIALPADLPAGRYAVRVGLYPPGHPETPVTPAGGAVPYVEGGWLEVQP